MPRWIRLLLFLVLIGVLLVLAGLVWVYHEFNSIPQQNTARTARFEVMEGQNVRQIADALAAQELIQHTRTFLLGYRLFYSGTSLKAGEYQLERPLSPRQLLHILSEGKILLHPITIPEGLTQREIARHLEEHYGLDADIFLLAFANASLIHSTDAQAEDLEGYLFPDTYHFPKNTSPQQMVDAMVDQFQQVFNETWISRAAERGLSIREVVILASLVENETSRAEERELVSAVFHNRLRIGMKLDCDPTIVYVLKNADEYTGRLRYKDLKLDDPYNTYLYPGLPPGPISNPGRAALYAALNPADVDYLYFVSRNDGSHHFSRTYREHQNAVNRYQRRSR
jgi:UPF0755 protein